MRNIESNSSLPVRQRRPRQAQAKVSEEAPQRDVKVTTRRRITLMRGASAIIPLFVIAGIFHYIFSTEANAIEPDNETEVTKYRIPKTVSTTATTTIQVSAQQIPVTCMPTVTRDNGKIEYISNSVKSWYLAHNGTPPPLHVYDMDIHQNFDNEWQKRIGVTDSSWLKVLRLNISQMMPTKFTLNDSKSRVHWRSKEARDYSAVLKDCVRVAKLSDTTSDDTLILIIQDDVLFNRDIVKSHQWATNVLSDIGRTRINSAGVEVAIRTCSASLFDLGNHVGDEPLEISNLVARFWRVGEALQFADYIQRHFDDAPVDWLADRWCRRRRAIVPVQRPNPVRHRGRVSSFIENKRDNLLT